MSDSDSSALSSAPSSGDEKLAPIFLNAKGKKTKKGALVPLIPVPPPRIRTPSPELPETLADNPDIAFIVMFRNRFSDAFPAKLAHLAPQDLERGVVDSLPSPQIEDLLCALLGIMLNRKKPVERGHYGRALEEAISSQRPQWPRSWNQTNPISSSKSFNTMSPQQRLDLLRHLIIWALSTSEQVSNIIKESYKQTRHDDDQNQPLSVQPWGKDSEKRAFYLIEGQDDTSFRVFREADRTQKAVWRSVAGSIEEIKDLATKLEKDSSISARQMAKSIHRTIPRFEATEEKRRRREYRQQQRSRFARPEPGFSLYEGRTRGKRMRYTFDDDDEDGDELAYSEGTRRSGRNADRTAATESAAPVVTASGRQVRQRNGGAYGESLLSGRPNASDAAMDDADNASTRASRSNGGRSSRHALDEDAHMSDGESESDGGWNSAENEEQHGDGDDDLDVAEGSEEELGTRYGTKRSSVMVVIKLPAAGTRSPLPELALETDEEVQPTVKSEFVKPVSGTETNGEAAKGEGEGHLRSKLPSQSPAPAQPDRDTGTNGETVLLGEEVYRDFGTQKSGQEAIEDAPTMAGNPEVQPGFQVAIEAGRTEGHVNGAGDSDIVASRVEGMNGTVQHPSLTV